MSFDNLCMNCFEKLTDGCICRKCGFDNDSPTDMLFLPRKTLLANRYIVGRDIAHDSDAATYMGYDTEKEIKITIRELLPKGIANRLEGNADVHIRERYKKNFEGYKRSFMELWKTLKSMNSLSAVIPVVDVFEENETVYAVSEWMATVSLRDFLLKSENNIIPWERARLMFMPVLTTLERLHENGIIHGGINPENLVLCSDGKVRLAGFCISECNMANSELEFNEHEGYTALEQYDNNHKICPATDIYAFSACIYRALVGTNPPSALSRETNDRLMIPNRIAETIPAYVIKALGAGLQIYPEKRIQNVYDYRELLNAAPSVVAKAAEIKAVEERAPEPEEKHVPVHERREQPKKKGISKGQIAAIVIAVLVVIAAVIGVLGVTGVLGGKEPETEQTTLPQVTVPDFSSVGYTESDIRNSGSWNEQFKITFEYAFSPDYDAGIVFKQSIEAGEQVQQGSAIVLTVSRGTQMVDVPDVGGLAEADAKAELEKLGFVVETVYVYNDGSHTTGNVKDDDGMAPEAGSSVPKGETVVIQVYGEIETTTAPPTTTAPSTTAPKTTAPRTTAPSTTDSNSEEEETQEPGADSANASEE